MNCRISSTLLLLLLASSEAFTTSPSRNSRTFTVQPQPSIQQRRVQFPPTKNELDSQNAVSCLGMSAGPVAGAIAGALTGGFFAGGLHAIAGE